VTIRLVLDTNVWLDWLLFDEPSVKPIKSAVAAGRAEIVIDAEGEAELVRVLAYPFGARTLDETRQAELIAQCRSIALKSEVGRRKSEAVLLPRCGDADDQKFLELALSCGAAFLVTRDNDLLDLPRGRVRQLPFRVVTPQALALALREERGERREV
jgi:uncharacterized protein